MITTQIKNKNTPTTLIGVFIITSVTSLDNKCQRQRQNAADLELYLKYFIISYDFFFID